MQKIKIIILSFLMVSLIGFASFGFLRASAAETGYSISGTLFLVSGNSDFYPAFSDNIQVNAIDYSGSKTYGFGQVNDKGQFIIKLTSLPTSSTDIITFSISTTGGEYIFMYCSQGEGISFGQLLAGGNYSDLYFRYFPLKRDISQSIYNYVYDDIMFSSSSSSPVNNLSFYSPGDEDELYSDMYFSGNIQYTGIVNSYPAFWFNFNNTKNEFVAGIGILGAYRGSTSVNPWQFYLKDNVTGRQVLIYNLANSDIKQMPTIRLIFRTQIINNSTIIDIYYSIVQSSGAVEGIINLGLSLSVDNIGSLVVQANNAIGSVSDYNVSFGVSRSISESWYTDVYEDGYNSGNEIGYNQGYNAGYSAGAAGQQYTFFSLISSLVDVPVNTLISIFDIEILGVNLKTFFFSIACIFLVVAIIRFLSGKIGSQDG